jgi:hypothetical protein
MVTASSCTSPRGISARHTQRGFTSNNSNTGTATASMAVQADNNKGTTSSDKCRSDTSDAAQAAINHLGLTIACDIKLREANILSRIQEENWPLSSFVHAQWDIKKTQNWQNLLSEIITAWNKHHTELSSLSKLSKNRAQSTSTTNANANNMQKLTQKVLSTLQDITDLLDHAKEALAKVDPRYPTTSEELQLQVTANNQDALQQIVELCVAVESFKATSIFTQLWNNGPRANIDISADEISEIETSLEDLINQLVEPKAWFDELASSYGKSGSTFRFF